jgi:hypothetical protein
MPHPVDFLLTFENTPFFCEYLIYKYVATDVKRNSSGSYFRPDREYKGVVLKFAM